VVLIKTRAKERTEKQVFKQRAQHRADSEWRTDTSTVWKASCTDMSEQTIRRPEARHEHSVSENNLQECGKIHEQQQSK
jgi:hypothetical protein